MKKTILFLALVATTMSLWAQKKTTTSAVIAFDASTLDNLPKAENKTAIAAIDTKTGSVQFEAAVSNFSFQNPLMQQHFNNASWLDSEKYPKFTFKGNIVDPAKVNFAKDGSYPVTVTGDLTVRDITKPITTTGTIAVKSGVISISAEFSIKIADYGISNVSIESGKVSREPKIKVSAELN